LSISLETMIYATVIGLSGLIVIALIALKSMGYRIRIKKITQENGEYVKAISKTGDYMERPTDFREEVEKMLLSEDDSTQSQSLDNYNNKNSDLTADAQTKQDNQPNANSDTNPDARIILKEDILGRVAYERGELYKDGKEKGDVFVVTEQLRKVYKEGETQKEGGEKQ